MTEISLSEDLKERRADAIWKVRWKNRSSSRSARLDVYLLILLEFQSTPTRRIVLRLLDDTLRLGNSDSARRVADLVAALAALDRGETSAEFPLPVHPVAYNPWPTMSP